MNIHLKSKFKLTTKVISIFVFFLAFLFVKNQAFAQKKEFVVVLDAGHGGKDPGKVGLKNVKEKDIALNIVLKVGKLLEKQKGIKVIYTRKTDVFINLWERGKIANKADADLFVSVHCNSWHTQSPNGIETYVLGVHGNNKNMAVAKAENEVILLEDNYEEKYKGFDPNSPESLIGLTLMQEEYLEQSIQLASLVQKNLVKDLKRRDRGVKQAAFVVLYHTYMPSILIETGFLTNPSDNLQLNSEKGQTTISKSIYNGIVKYIEQLNLNSVVVEQVDYAIEGSTEIKKREEVETIITEESNLIYKVQIASGSRKLETKSYNFKGLKNVERVKVGNSYKYYLGNTNSLEKIKELQKLAKSKGYSSAFIVTFKNGVKIASDLN
jgi:N-acetylmuramoyl-L-alanine amidase